MNINKKNLIRINAAYFRQEPSECAKIIKQVCIHAARLKQEEKKHFINRFIYSPTFLELIRHAYEHRNNDMLTVLLLALDPTNPLTEIILKELNHSKNFDVRYLAAPSAELINEVCNLEYLDIIISHFDNDEFNKRQNVAFDKSEAEPSQLKLDVRNKLRKQIIDASTLNGAYFYLSTLMLVFYEHEFVYLLKQEDSLAIDLILLIHEKSYWPLIQIIIHTDQDNSTFLLSTYLVETIAEENIPAMRMLLNIRLNEKIDDINLEHYMNQCREANFLEGLELLEQYDSGSARTNPNAFFTNKRRKLESTECAEVMMSLSTSGK